MDGPVVLLSTVVLRDGEVDGLTLGLTVGPRDGLLLLGTTDGLAVGPAVGLALGPAKGPAVGLAVGVKARHNP